MEEKKEERRRWRLRRPLRVTADRLQALEAHLKTHHRSVEVVAVAEDGVEARGDVDALTHRGGMWGRMGSVHFTCREPDLSLHLHDTPWRVATLVWISPASDQSAAGVRRDLPHWFRWSLLPCDILLSLMVVLITLWLPSVVRLPSALADQERARAEAARRLDEYVKAKTSSPQEAKALKEEILRGASRGGARRTWLWPVLGLAAGVVLAATGTFRFIAGLWGKLFPAAHWDFPAQAHVFAAESVRLWVLRIAVLLLLAYYGVSAYGWVVS